MCIYSDHVLPRLLNVAMNTEPAREIRKRLCSGLSGEVIEFGFGAGHNLPFLPAGVTRVVAVEPAGVAIRLAGQRIARCGIPVQVAGPDAQRLPLADACADSVLTTWTLCSIPDPVLAVREARRVLRPGGRLFFAEHGQAPDAGIRRWQNRLNGVHRRIAGGCNLNREIAAIIEAGGMTIVRLDRYYARHEPRPYAAMYEGVAVAA